MQKQKLVLYATMLAAIMPFATVKAIAGELRPSFMLAMMDMMPMGSGAMPQPMPGGAAMPGMPTAPGAAAAPAPGGMDKMMGMGGGGMPAQAQNAMPTDQMPQTQAAGMCAMMAPMMAMMQNMMRMGSAQQGAMPPMQGGSASGAGMAPGMSAMGMSATGPAGSPAADSVARLDGRIAYLRGALRITDAQAAVWDGFVATLRVGRDHLDAARIALQDSTVGTDPMGRLESYETHLKARTDAIHMTRMAFGTLYGQLDEAQKRVATSNMLPFIGAF